LNSVRALAGAVALLLAACAPPAETPAASDALWAAATATTQAVEAGRRNAAAATDTAVAARANATLTAIARVPSPTSESRPVTATGTLTATLTASRTATLATAQPTAGAGAIGQRQESAGVALTIANALRLSEIPPGFQPRAGTVYLLVDAQVENTGRAPIPYNAAFFKVRDGDGVVFSGSTPPGGELPFKSGALAPGARVRGNVGFQVKVTATRFVLSYEPTTPPGDYQPIRVDLRQ
jgi:hypothetical protein